MVVISQLRQGRISGLAIGASNARRYFPRHTACIEIELDHLRICCDLSPRFWSDSPAIEDARLNDWLESKRQRGSKRPQELKLEPLGSNLFRLGPLPAQSAGHLRTTALTA